MDCFGSWGFNTALTRQEQEKDEAMNLLLIITILQVVCENVERDTVFSQAKAKAVELGKPLLNAGCGQIKPIGGFPRAILESDVNLDISPMAVPRFVQSSVERIPYPDKYFGAAFCCHVLEHIDDLEQGLQELYRVADYVYIIVPSTIWPSTWLHTGHKRVFLDDKVVTFEKHKLLGRHE